MAPMTRGRSYSDTDLPRKMETLRVDIDSEESMEVEELQLPPPPPLVSVMMPSPHSELTYQRPEPQHIESEDNCAIFEQAYWMDHFKTSLICLEPIQHQHPAANHTPLSGAGFTAALADLSLGRPPKKEVTFYAWQSVLYIPSHDQYSESTRAALWADRREIASMAARNLLEYAYEGFDWQRALTEDMMIPSDQNAHERIHPVHMKPLLAKALQRQLPYPRAVSPPDDEEYYKTSSSSSSTLTMRSETDENMPYSESEADRPGEEEYDSSRDHGAVYGIDDAASLIERPSSPFPWSGDGTTHEDSMDDDEGDDLLSDEEGFVGRNEGNWSGDHHHQGFWGMGQATLNLVRGMPMAKPSEALMHMSQPLRRPNCL